MLQQFLDYARDGTEEEPTLADLNAVAGEVGERFRNMGATLSTNFHGTLSFQFRKLARYRVIANVVGNAVHYGREGVELETWVEGVPSSR